MSNEPITGEVLNQMPAQTTNLPATENPYQGLVATLAQQGKISEMRELLALQKEWDDEKARKAFVSAMADFKAEAGGITITKSKHVSFKTSTGKTEYDHAELHDITRALVPVMAKHGLSHRWTLKQEGGTITVDCVISHRDGHSESVTMSAGADNSGGKNNIQAIASTKTYLERYTLLAATGVATGGEMDNDGATYDAGQDDVEYISDAQLATLTDLADVYIPKGTKRDAFLEYVSKQVGFTVTGLGEIPAKDFDAVHDQIKRIALKKQGGGDAS